MADQEQRQSLNILVIYFSRRVWWVVSFIFVRTEIVRMVKIDPSDIISRRFTPSIQLRMRFLSNCLLVG